MRLNHYRRDHLDDIRSDLLDVYDETRREFAADSPFHSVERFAERLEGHSRGAGWEVVLASQGESAVGFAYGYPLPRGARWWQGIESDRAEEYFAEDGTRTFALCEIRLRTAWRGTGLAVRIHDELMAARPEERATLLVDPARARLKALYERWGYQQIGVLQPFPDSPRYAAMVKTLRS